MNKITQFSKEDFAMLSTLDTITLENFERDYEKL
jgi:hypothetical protein